MNIPDSWIKTTVGYICKTTSGGTPSRKNSEYYNGDISWLKSGELKDEVIYHSEESITVDGLNNSSAKMLSPDTLLIALYGATVGRMGILGIPASTNQAICAITTPNGLKQRYLFWYLKYVRNDLLNKRIGGAQPNISQQIIRETEISLPPLPEQNRIVARIEELFTKLDAGVESLQKAKALLKQYRQSVLKAAVEGRLTEEWRRENADRIEPASALLERIQAERKQRLGKKYKSPKPIDTSNLPQLPDGWVWATWEDILSNEDGAFKRGPFGSTLKKSMFVESGYKVYEQYCPINDDCSFERYFITEQKYKEMESFAVQAGDYLISCSGSLGKITQVPSQFKKGIINQALLRVRINTKFYSDPFFMHFFRSPYFQKQLLTNTTGSAIQNLKGVRELKAIPNPLMSIQEQDIIVKEIDRLFSIIDKSELIIDSELKRSHSLRQSILKRAFEGKLVPQDSNDEPASVLLERIKDKNKINVS